MTLDAQTRRAEGTIIKITYQNKTYQEIEKCFGVPRNFKERKNDNSNPFYINTFCFFSSIFYILWYLLINFILVRSRADINL